MEKYKKAYIETHYNLCCPECAGSCHCLYVHGEYPEDRLVCRKCWDRLNREHPLGCVCWEDWHDAKLINTVCNSFQKDKEFDDCAKCQHDEECHKKEVK